MSATDLKLAIQVASVKVAETRQDCRSLPRAYRTPEMHAIGKAAELVQGGGGGNYLDANRTRYY